MTRRDMVELAELLERYELECVNQCEDCSYALLDPDTPAFPNYYCP